MSDAVKRSTPALDALVAQTRMLGGEYTLDLGHLSAENRAKLANLARTGRPFLEVTAAARRHILDAVRAGATSSLSAVAFGNAAGDAFRDAVLARFEAQGGDVTLARLGPEYRAYKLRHGLDPRIGVATGALLRALRQARFRFVKGAP